jgi:hypothetical protein
VTAYKDEIRKLIADIDNLLVNSGNPLSKLLSGHGQEEREVLHRVRELLSTLEEAEEGPTPEAIPADESQTPPLSSLLTRYVEQEQNQAASKFSLSQQEQINFTASQIKEEISLLLQPLQAELSGLLQERASLIQEIRQLEQKRLQNYSLTQQLANQEQIIHEFIQVLISRLVPNLLPYLTKNVANSGNLTPGDLTQEASNSAIQPVLESAQGIEKLNNLVRDLDQHLLSLDGTVNVVFEALERNIQTYAQSLSQALTRMHSQGMQGEQLMVNFLNNFSQNLQKYYPDVQPFVLEVDSETQAPTVLPAEESISEQVVPTQESEIIEDLDSVLSQLTVEPPSAEVVEDVHRSTAEELISEQVTQTQESAIIEDLDAVLSQLTVEPSSTEVVEDVHRSTAEELVPEQVAQTQEPEIIEDLDSVMSQLTLQQPSTTVNELQADTTPTQEPEIIENLDILLSQITAQRTSTLETQSFFDGSASQEETFDEVDELYASLFGGTDVYLANDVTNVPEVVSEVEGTETESPTDDVLVLLEQPIEQENLAVTVQNLESLPEIAVVEVETTEQTAELWERPLLSEDTQVQAEFATVPSYLESRPDSSDTITVLTDLLVDFSSEEQVAEVISQQQESETVTPEIPMVSSGSETSIQEQNLPPTPSIPVSQAENLLSVENVIAETEGIPKIVLDEAQLQQLDRDLANFDWRLNLESEQTTSSQTTSSASLPDMVSASQEIPDLELPLELPVVESPSTSTTEKENVPLASVADLVADLYVPQAEKKNQPTNSSPEVTARAEYKLDNKLNDNLALTAEDANSVWYLGIDVGTTGISAALLNRSRLVVYPIYWSAESKSGESAFEQSFRLPAEVYLPTVSMPHAEAESTENVEQRVPAAVAQNQARSASTSAQNLYSAHLKPFLQVAVPYQNRQQKWEPVLQLNEFLAGPLIWVVRSLSKLLLTLKSDATSTTPALIAHGVGIDATVFSEIINNLAGVICNCPSHWSEQYRFNVREAILASQLVSHPQQIFFVEEAIASLLPELDLGNSQSVQLRENHGFRPLKTSENSLRGNTLTLNVGATATEMALVDLSTDWSKLTYRDFMLHSFAYAGKAMEQDIICQLLLPPKSRQPRRTIETGGQTPDSHPRSWQPSIPGLDQVAWSSLSLEGLELPRVGEPDVMVRSRLQQRLESSLVGQGLLDAALALKLILQHQESFTLELADQCWTLQRRDLETQIFVPYVRRLNRELNKLLVARGVPTEAINQAILCGGVASVGTVMRWLRQKLPNAKIIQDFYLNENGAPNCSRVAYGLTMLPLYPQVLETPRQQYTDYFLFTELLKVLSDHLRGEAMRSLSFGEVLHLFESRGINTRICQQRLLAFLEGELPAGLVPVVTANSSENDDNQASLNSIWLTKKSQENPDYQAIASAPLFDKQGNLSYRPHPQQILVWQRYLNAIQESALQSLEEPLAVNFVTSINS